MKTQRNLIRCLCLALTLVVLPKLGFAGIEWETVRELKLINEALDVTASFDGKLIFTLTPGEILVYSTVDDEFIDRIPVAAIYTRIAYSNDERLILSAANPATLNIIKFDKINDIIISNRPFIGVETPKITLAVFDDYQ